jgi:hypothetical protein
MASRSSPTTRNRILLTLGASDRRGALAALGPADRWTWAARGASDRQLLAVASERLGISGGCAGPGRTYVTYKGGAKPEIVLHPERHRSRRIAGGDLALLIRELFNIPQPVHRRSLFEAVDG